MSDYRHEKRSGSAGCLFLAGADVWPICNVHRTASWSYDRLGYLPYDATVREQEKKFLHYVNKKNRRLMAYSVFFREAKKIFTANNFISLQPTAHRELLQTMAETLAANGRIVHPLATKTASGEWSVLLKDDNGDVYIYTLFISRFEQEEANRKIEDERPPKKRELMIIDPSGPRDSVGGYHPGYWSITRYASLLEEEQGKVFLQTIDQIKYNIPSDHYSVNDDDSISIHIHKQGRAYTISVACRAEWR